MVKSKTDDRDNLYHLFSYWENMTFEIVYPKDIQTKQKEKNAIIVDLRDTADFRKGHYQGAVNVPIESGRENTAFFSKKRYYILYCEHGGSSMQMARKLGLAGFHVATVVGGYEAMKKI